MDDCTRTEPGVPALVRCTATLRSMKFVRAGAAWESAMARAARAAVRPIRAVSEVPAMPADGR